MSVRDDDALAQALKITEQMFAAADQSNWTAVTGLDAQLQRVLREDVLLQPGDEPRLRLLLEKNSMLMQAATAARGTIEQELGQHNYNHKALNVYVSSSD